MTDTRLAPANDWRAAVWTAFHARLIIRSTRDVLLTLATFRGHGGRIWPSHATLAARVGCCTKTVVRAMAQAREAGLVWWRAIRWQTPGGYWRRKSNLYALRTPTALGKGVKLNPLGVPAGRRAPPKRHLVSEGEQQNLSKEVGHRGRSVAQQVAALAVGTVETAQAALARAAERMLARQRQARGI